MTTPLPEPHFLWRRLFTFVSTAIGYGVLIYIVRKMGGDEPLAKVAMALIALLAVHTLSYMIAPTAEAIARGIAEARRS
jgi:hypothetical protein